MNKITHDPDTNKNENEPNNDVDFESFSLQKTY